MKEILTKKFDSDDSSDEDYVPIELESEERPSRDTNKSKKYAELQKKRIEEIWNEMNNEYQEKINNEKCMIEQLIPESISEILKKINNDGNKDKLVAFAGKIFDTQGNKVDSPIVNKDENINDDKDKNSKKGRQEYLQSLLKAIDTKVINSMLKSKYDWKDYTKQNDLERKFAENRKDGYLEKARFLEKSRQEEKEFLRSKRQKLVDS